MLNEHGALSRHCVMCRSACMAFTVYLLLDVFVCVADDYLDGADRDAGSEEGEVGDDSGWGDTASSPQQSQQTRHGGSVTQTSDHAQVLS